MLEHSHELDNIFRIMLTVAVDGHSIVEPHLNGLAETRAQSMSLASVVLVADKSDQRRGLRLDQCVDERLRIVGRTIVDHNDRVGEGQKPLDDIDHRIAVVVGRNDDTEFWLHRSKG